MTRLFILPMCCVSFLRNFIHSASTNLHLHPFPFLTHHCGVQRFISVSFRSADPVAQTIRIGCEVIRYYGIHFPAIRFFSFIRRINCDTDSKQVIYFLKSNLLLFHFIPDRVNRFWPALYFVFKTFFIEFFPNRTRKLLYKLFTFLFTLLKLQCNGFENFRLSIFQCQIIQFGFDGIQSQTMRQW